MYRKVVIRVRLVAASVTKMILGGVLAAIVGCFCCGYLLSVCCCLSVSEVSSVMDSWCWYVVGSVSSWWSDSEC